MQNVPDRIAALSPTRRRALTLAASGAVALGAFPAVVRAQTSSFRLGASSAATQAEGYFADQLGYFKQAGLTAALTVTGRGSETLAAVSRGDIDIASATPQAVANAIIHEIPIKIIAVGGIYVEPPAVGFFVAKDSGVRAARDIAEGTVAVNSLGDSQTLGVWQWMANQRVDASKVKIVEIPFSAIAAAIKRKDVIGGCLVEPFMTAGKDDVRIVPGVYGSLGYHWALGVWYARTEYIEKNVALVKQVVNALHTTAKYVNANPAVVDPLLVTYTKLPLETVRAIAKPVWSEKTERSSVDPQLQAAARFKVISRVVSYEEAMFLG